MTSRPPDRSDDQFEHALRQALADEAGGPAPDRLVRRIAELRRTETGPSPLSVVLSRVARPARTFGPGFGVLLAAALVVALALAFRGFGTGLIVGPGASASAGPSASISNASPSTAPSTPTPVVTPRPSPVPTANEGPVGGPVPAGFEPVSTTWVSTSRGWLLGTAPCGSSTCAAVLRTTNGGATWASIPAPRTAVQPSWVSSGGVSRLRFADPLDGWAFGPELWATHDGGATWRQVRLPDQASTDQVMALEAAAGAVHVAYGSPNGIRVSSAAVGSDGWSVSTTVPFGAGPVPQPQIVLHGTAGWVVEVDRTVIAGARFASGAGWRAWDPPCLTANGPADLAASSELDLVAACDVGVWATPEGVHLYASSDGGVTFHQAATKVPVTGLWGVAVAPGTSTVVVAGYVSNSANGLVASFDGGKTWQVVHRTTGVASISELGFTSASQGVAIVTAEGGASQLVMTTDGGRTWKPVTLAGG